MPIKPLTDGKSAGFHALALVLLVAISFLLRLDAFWLPHWKGDQSHYVSLAMKLDKMGLGGYSLRQVRLGSVDFEDGAPVQVSVAALAEPGSQGDLIRVLHFVHQDYYDEPLHMRAPLFPYAVMWSHRLFESKDPYYRVISSNLGESVRTIKPAKVFKIQFWVSIIPIFFLILCVILTYGLAFIFFRDGTIAFWPAFIIATDPVGMTTSYRLLTESFTLFFVLLSALFFWLARGKKGLWRLLVCGVFLGAAVIARQTAGVLIFVLWGYLFLSEGRSRGNLKGIIKNGLHPHFLTACAGMLLASGFWFWKVYSVYGNPFHVPAEGMKAAFTTDISGWFASLARRPHPVIFFSAGVVAICPVFLASGLTVNSAWQRAVRMWNEETRNDFLVFLWLWVIGFYLYVSQPWKGMASAYSQEHRYFYMAYPALAILSVEGLRSLAVFLKAKLKIEAPVPVLIACVCLLSAVWSVPLAMKLIFKNDLLL